MILRGQYGLLGLLKGVNANITTDQAVSLVGANSIIRRIVACNASVSLTTAVGGIYTGASKTGTAVVGATQVYSALTTSSKFVDLTVAVTADIISVATLYVSLTTAQGAAATFDLYVYGELL